MEKNNLIEPWGTLNFHLPLGGLSQIRGLKFFIKLFFGGDNRVYSTGGGEGAPPPLTKNLLVSPTPGKVPPSRVPPPKVHSPPLNNIFNVITQ